MAAMLASSPAAGQLAGLATATPAAEEQVLDVRIPSAPGVILAATLRLPKRSGRYPAVILQTGSGPNTRGAYLTLQRRLIAAGIATLDFEKRGVGQSTGTFTDSMGDMETDLAAAIAWLRTRADIDGARIALLGHSQGAAAAPIVADRDGSLAAIVFLAGPVGDRGTMFLDGMRAQLIEGGRSPDAAESVVGAARIWMEARSRKAPGGEIVRARADLVAAFTRAGFPPQAAEGATKVLDTPQLLSFYEAAPGPALRRLRIPVLVVLAGRDEIVDPPGAAAALGENPNALVLTVPGAGHNFAYRPADAPPRTNPPGGRWLFPEPLIARWLTDWLVHGGMN
ncbi:alpha/beta hydrolase family protein [Sphingomonas sp.]|uniref:alpha/beta hydrolase family protein n=1 Tax=Sphingomonas sp. TaxID=28214 RepID=UPI002ED8BF70